MNVILSEVKHLLKSFLIWTVVCGVMLVLFMAFFPSMKSSGMGELMKAKMDAIPQAMRESLGISSYMDFSDLMQYFAYCWQYILLAVCIYAAMLGANSLIKEESYGTIEFLYAKPISRMKIITGKMISNFVIIGAFNLVLFIVNLIVLNIFKTSNYNFINKLLAITFSSAYASVVFLFVGFLMSVILKRASQATPAALGLFFITYILGMFAAVVKSLKWLKYLSPYHYVMPNEILKSGSLKLSYGVIMLVIIMVSAVCSIYIYKRKDFNI